MASAVRPAQFSVTVQDGVEFSQSELPPAGRQAAPDSQTAAAATTKEAAASDAEFAKWSRI
jgi:hypothetical protein